jgi:NADH dehydrogenase FAD-containing subunit
MAPADMYVCPPINLPKQVVRFADIYRSNVDVLVIGAGPTGLGAAKRLNQIVRWFHTANTRHRVDFS